MEKITKLVFMIMIGIFMVSCADFLDVSMELADEEDMEDIFSNPAKLRRFHRELYNGIPNSMNLTWWSEFTGHPGQSNVWALFSDEMCKGVAAFPYSLPLSPANGAAHDIFRRWEPYYQWIRQANLFLENAKEIPIGGSADFVGPVELAELMAQAKFFRAYYHYLLFEIYGPIPIVDHAMNPSDKDLDFARNSIDEVVDFIYKELTDVADELEDPDLTKRELLGIPTKGAALAIRARLMIYAASPLFNGGFNEGLALTNKDGKRLFPDKDPAKWQKALDACQAFINYANSGYYELYKVETDGVLDPHKSIYEVHMSFNEETIFARTTDDYLNNANRLDYRNIPRGARGGTTLSGGAAVTQELVDAFFMIDGLSIEESPLYEKSKEFEISVAGDDLSGQTEVGTRRMFINREPRFYQTVFYNGRRWHIGNESIEFFDGGNSGRTGATRYSRTGYLMYKRMSRRVYNEGSHPRSEYRPPIVHRLAEFYLLYAEALNEVNPNDSRIIEYVDMIRERAGVPLLADIRPEIIGNYQAQKEAIIAEARVELCTEGQRFHDLRRWMLATEGELGKGKLDGPFYGLNVFAPLSGFYERTETHVRAFGREKYFMPIPQDEIQKSRQLVQNPGY